MRFLLVHAALSRLYESHMALVYLAALLDRVYTIVRVCLHIVAPPGVASSQISRRTEEKAINAWCIPRYGF